MRFLAGVNPQNLTQPLTQSAGEGFLELLFARLRCCSCRNRERPHQDAQALARVGSLVIVYLPIRPALNLAPSFASRRRASMYEVVGR